MLDYKFIAGIYSLHEKCTQGIIENVGCGGYRIKLFLKHKSLLELNGIYSFCLNARHCVLFQWWARIYTPCTFRLLTLRLKQVTASSAMSL